MLRRDFLAFATTATAGSLLAISPGLSMALSPPEARNPYARMLVLLELKGGSDSLNMLVPFADEAYYRLRPKLALPASELIRLDERVALNKVMEAMLPLWEQGELAFVQGVGYPQPNLSHFRSIEIWDAASRSDEYLDAGWLSRTFARWPLPSAMTADALVLGSADLGPLAGGARAISLDQAGRFERQARLAQLARNRSGDALSHVLRVENDVQHAAQSLGSPVRLLTEFPNNEFGRNCKLACETLARTPGVAVMRLSLPGFDTHQNQLATHANLLRQLAEGLSALRAGLIELGRWNDTLVMSYAEFGRRVHENSSGGTDHGTAASHLIAGGRVRGGLYGEMPDLNALDGVGNLRFKLDFRQLYATVLERWWGLPSAPVLAGQFATLPVV